MVEPLKGYDVVEAIRSGYSALKRINTVLKLVIEEQLVNRASITATAAAWCCLS